MTDQTKSITSRIIGGVWKPLILGSLAAGLIFSTIISNQVEDLPNLPITTGKSFGTAFVDANADILDFVVNKQGGFVANDVLPPFVFLDNIPSCEMGMQYSAEKATGGLLFISMINSNFMESKMFYTQKGAPQQSVAIAAKVGTKIGPMIGMQGTENSYKDAIKMSKELSAELNNPNSKLPKFEIRASDLSFLLDSYVKYLSRIDTQLNANLNRKMRERSDAVVITAVEESIDQGDAKPIKEILAKEKLAKDALDVKAKENANYWEIDDAFHEARCSAWAIRHSLMALAEDYKTTIADKSIEADFQSTIDWLGYVLNEFATTYVQHGTGYGFFNNFSYTIKGDLSNSKAALAKMSSHLKTN